MAMRLSEVRSKIKTATVTWDDETVDVGWCPARFTPDVAEAVNDAEKADDLGVLGALLEPILEWWDVLDDDDKRLPTDKATISGMPMAFLMKVMADLQEDMNPPESRG